MAYACVSLQLLLVLLLLQLMVCVCAPPRLLPYSGLSRNQLITKYFFDGYPYKTILILLGLLHGISLSLRQLKRILRSLGLHRRTVRTSIHLHRVETYIRVGFIVDLVLVQVMGDFYRGNYKDQVCFWGIDHSGNV